MKSFNIVILIYNSAMAFIVTRISTKPYRFKVETRIGEPHALVLKLMPGNHFIAEHVSFKYFTKVNIQKLGVLIKHEKLRWAL